MRKSLLLYIFIILFGLSFQAMAQEAENESLELAEDEVRDNTNSEFRFRSFYAPDMKRNPEDLIIGIGERITRDMKANGDEGGNIRRYHIKRFLPEGSLYGADVIVLGERARVNHIVNVRRIVQGYLMENHGYSKERSRAFAYFLLVYNGIKREDRNYLQQRFIPSINEYIPEGKMGIDAFYENWPGQTYIVIPLRFDGQSIPASEVGQVAQDEVADDNTKLREREEFVEEREEQLDEEKERINEDSERIVDEQEALEQEKEESDKELAEIEQEKENADDPEELAALEEREQAIREEKTEQETKQEELDQEKENLEDRVIAAEDEAASIEEEKEEIARDEYEARESDLAAEETALKEDRAQPNYSLGEVFFLKTVGVNGSRYQQQLISIDPASDSITRLTVSNVTGRSINFIDGDPIVLMQEPIKKEEVYLTRLNRDTMQVKAQGQENIYNLSQVWLHDGHVYVIGIEDGGSHLFKYDPNMKMLAKSEDQVFNDTYLTFAAGKVYSTVMQENKVSHVIVFDQNDLSQKAIIR